MQRQVDETAAGYTETLSMGAQPPPPPIPTTTPTTHTDHPHTTPPPPHQIPPDHVPVSLGPRHLGHHRLSVLCPRHQRPLLIAGPPPRLHPILGVVLVVGKQHLVAHERSQVRDRAAEVPRVLVIRILVHVVAPGPVTVGEASAGGGAAAAAQRGAPGRRRRRVVAVRGVRAQVVRRGAVLRAGGCRACEGAKARVAEMT